jgi:hypothetical protein
MMKHRLSDPVIDEIRKTRHRISARFNHDPAQLITYYMELQEQHRDQLIKTPNSAARRSSNPPDPAVQRTRRKAARR